MITVGVTGTNGKTTTTSFVAAALASLARPVACVTTLGFQIDQELVSDVSFPELMQRLRSRGGRFAAVEYTSEALARGYAREWPATIGVFTNLTHDHLDAHGSVEHYLASKAQLFMSLAEGGTAVLNAADESSVLIEEVVPSGCTIRRYWVPSRGEACAPADLRADQVEVGWDGTRITLPEWTIHLRAIGEVFAENALAAILAAVAAGVPHDRAAAALEGAAAPPGRFQVVGERPWVVVDYAHSPDSLARTLATAKRLCEGRLHVVFGAGGNRDRNKRAPMGAAASVADHIVLTTDNPRDESAAAIAAAIREGVHGPAQVETLLDRGDAIERTVRAAAKDDVVVIAGKGHERSQTIAGHVTPFDDVEHARRVVG